jgi:2-polyprenyl-3-methyl-5-hydroxy-6-metoxy-1,4-benzoquinol methylase
VTARLSTRDLAVRELMDDPDCDRRMLERTYHRFAAVNAVVSRPGAIYRRDIRPRAEAGRPLRILDIGAGGGDLCRLIARRMRRDRHAADITALDADERAISWASAHDEGAGVRYMHATTQELVAAGEQFDVIVSNHVLHHLTDAELQAVLADSRRLLAPGGLIVHHDIARARAAYALFSIATALLAWNLLAGSFIRVDGLISIRRSYTVAEISAAAPEGWVARRRFPFRIELRGQD